MGNVKNQNGKCKEEAAQNFMHAISNNVLYVSQDDGCWLTTDQTKENKEIRHG